jgi:hypothetical protein
MPQNFANHARYQPLFHYVASPIVGVATVHLLWVAIRNPTARHIGDAVLMLGIGCGIWVARTMAVTVQNRVIRLEMRLRLKEILPGALLPRIPDLTVRQLVALRFASDAELPALVERTLKGEFARPRDIKRAITDWQPDLLRC